MRAEGASSAKTRRAKPTAESSAHAATGEQWAEGVVFLLRPRELGSVWPMRLAETWRCTFAALRSVPPFRCSMHHGRVRSRKAGERGDVVIVRALMSEWPQLTAAMQNLDQSGMPGAFWIPITNDRRRLSRDVALVVERDATGSLHLASTLDLVHVLGE